MPKRRFQSALVLSGGSARGLSHLGVIEEIEHRDMAVDLIVGSSMGALIGGLYAYYRDVGQVSSRLRNFFGSHQFLKISATVLDERSQQPGQDGFFNRFIWLFRKGVYYTHSVLKSEIVQHDIYRDIIETLIPDIPIEELPTRFAAIAMDLLTGEEVVLTRGSLRNAVAASSAIPGLFPVIEIDGRPLIDGGWVDNVPVAPAIALGAHFVVAVDATLEIDGLEYPQSAIETVFRCNEITRIILTRQRKSRADVLLVPAIGPMFWADFAAIDRCIVAGRKAFSENARKISRKTAVRRGLTLEGLIHPARTREWKHPFLIL